jgi:hypothetical protein
MMRGWVWIGVLLGVCALAFGQQKVDVEKVQARYRQLVGAVSDARLAETVRWMAAQGSRVAGYPGADRAADYIERQFRALGLQNVRREAFPITVPVDEEAHLHLNGQKLRVYTLWPNQVRTSQLPPDGIRGNLIYVRDGQLQQFRGKPVEGSIVLMDFNTGNNWLNAARLGARAIVFIEPETTTRGEAEAKFIGIPLDVPRFWLPRQHAAKLIALAETQPDLQAKLTCRMPWQVREGYNIVGVLPGSDPALKDQWIVVTAYYDSISIVPLLAPGADSAAGIASLLELARVFRQYPPKRSVLFVALSGHFQALEGVRQFIEARLPDWSRPNVFESLGGRPPSQAGHLPVRRAGLGDALDRRRRVLQELVLRHARGHPALLHRHRARDARACRTHRACARYHARTNSSPTASTPCRDATGAPISPASPPSTLKRRPSQAHGALPSRPSKTRARWWTPRLIPSRTATSPTSPSRRA